MKQIRRHIQLTETARIPWDGFILGWAAMLPFAVLAAGIWLFGLDPEPAAALAQLWGGALLLFFSGVRRGLSFRTKGGPTLRQLASFALLFCAGLLVLISPLGIALGILAGAFAALAWEDVSAASRAEVPLYFRNLRPTQMLFGIVTVFLCWLAA
ncbi:DUF3429 domain-containing protein [Loktanella sp. SALINAS62]|uniref:DUF3429 domain-containing protein n=1 Tax=Loktanella sp. SALINAS62 TaxID=2706124 RepID=UPI001B8D3E08|nr:DUF3429 domain-containing protein [Loktanella sp. SALINAS62]MBS1302413.1 DUF3429 domain-containing protein [Loktanella sp. SALINAS62]